MRRIRKGVLALFAVSLVGIFSAFAGTAVAAGLPELEGIKTFNTNIVEAKSEAWVNPNGATTTFKAEYRLVGAKTWTSGPAQSVGSGTEWKIALGSLRLSPEASYEVRISATNSFGTTQEVVSKNFASAAWSIETGVGSASFSSSGIYTLKATMGGIAVKIECTEAGSGSLGNPEGTGNSYSFSTSNCSYYQGAKFICHPEAGPFGATMNGSFVDTSGNRSYSWCPGEEGGGKNVLTIAAPYSVTMAKQAEPLTTQPVTLTASALINGFTSATVTITTNWKLSGAQAGLKFSVGNL